MTILYGAFLGNRRTSGALQLIAETIADVENFPDTATGSISFQTSGIALRSDGTTYNWLSGGSAADYDIRATVASGSFSSGVSGSWLNLATLREWTVSRSTVGFKSCTATFEISLTGQATAIVTASITLSAQLSS